MTDDLFWEVSFYLHFSIGSAPAPRCTAPQFIFNSTAAASNMTTRGIERNQAIKIAVDFLNSCLPSGSPPSHIAARHICSDELIARRKELHEFLAQNGQNDSELLRIQTERMGLNEDHWYVQFHVIDEPGTASTTPPTMVRVYDADGRAELYE